MENRMALIVPDEIERVVTGINEAVEPVEIDEISQLLRNAADPRRMEDDRRRGAWAEVAAFSLAEDASNLQPWNTYFGPVGSGIKDGAAYYFPEVRHLDSEILDHWIARATAIRHPVLKARYADLAWELSRPIDNRRSNPEHARIAIDAYLDAQQSDLTGLYHSLVNVRRALDLARLVNDEERTFTAKEALLNLFEKAVEEYVRWDIAFDRLIDERKAGLTEDDRSRMVQALEVLFRKFSNRDDPASFNPFELEQVAQRLARYYRRTGSRDDFIRIRDGVGGAFEHLAGLGNPMQAIAWLQQAENAFTEAGKDEDSQRVRVAREHAITASHSEVQHISASTRIDEADLEEFLESLVQERWPNTLAAIANAFLWHVSSLEEAVKRSATKAPIAAMLPIQIVADEHVAAEIGSVEDDLEGRVIHDAQMRIQLESRILKRALLLSIERHNLSHYEIASFVARAGLFEDVTFLVEGLKAWLTGDPLKALFVLVPQIEYALRNLTNRVGEAVTKPHRKIAGRDQVINLGDILSTPSVKKALGADMTFYFRAIYSDARGLNLRNDLAHGLLSPVAANDTIVSLVIHSLLVIGAWAELAKARNSPKN